MSERTEEGRKPDLLRLYIDAIGLHQARKLSCVEAAELLGMSERHFRRLRDAYEAHGAEGIVDRFAGLRVPSRVSRQRFSAPGASLPSDGSR